MDKNDLKLVGEVLQNEKVDILNTRAFKTNDKEIIISVGSIEHSERVVEHAGI